jgi:hypothetical protein
MLKFLSRTKPTTCDKTAKVYDTGLKCSIATGLTEDLPIRAVSSIWVAALSNA